MNHRLNRLFRDHAGTSTAEYAIIIALIAASIMLASDSIRLSTDSSFRRASVALGVEPALTTTASNATPVENSPATLPVLSIATMPPIHAFAWGVLIAAAAIVAHSRYRRLRCRRVVRDIESIAEPAAEHPSNPNFKKRQDIQRTLLQHFDDAVQSRIEVRHVMSRKTRAIEPSASLRDLRDLMETEHFHHLLVMRHGALVGVISDRDLYNKKGRRAADIMTANPLTVSPKTNIRQAITSMLHARISCLPVVEDGHVQGILTTTDMLMSLQCLMQLLERLHASPEQVTDVGPARSDTQASNAPAAIAT